MILIFLQSVLVMILSVCSCNIVYSDSRCQINGGDMDYYLNSECLSGLKLGHSDFVLPDPFLDYDISNVYSDKFIDSDENSKKIDICPPNISVDTFRKLYYIFDENNNINENNKN